MVDPKFLELHVTFLNAIRKFIAEECPSALDALDEYASYTAPEHRPKLKHVWRAYEITPESLRGAPQTAQTTIRKQGYSGRICTECGCLSNKKYPYWFRAYDGKNWQMRDPSCTAEPTTEKE